MKKHKGLKIVLFIIFIPFILLFFVRFINGLRYPKQHFENFQDMSTYPLVYDGMTVEPIKQGILNGFHIIPSTKISEGVIVTFGGSEGGCNYFHAIDLAKNGHEVVSLFYFGQENQPKELNKVPLEFFGEFLSYAQDKNINTKILTLLGSSKGAELAFLLTNYYNEIDNVVLFAPSCYVFQGLDFEKQGSSWTYQNQELSYISFMNSSLQSLFQMVSAMVFNYPYSLRANYETAVQNSENVSLAFIDSSKFSGNILMFSGKDDAMWHSSVMAQEIFKANNKNIENIVYEDVGHIFEDFTYAYGADFGGAREKNLEAKTDSYSRVLQFLSKYHR